MKKSIAFVLALALACLSLSVSACADELIIREDAGGEFRPLPINLEGGAPLKGRTNLVLSRQDLDIPGATVVHSPQEAAEAAAKLGRCLVIGGASVYRQMMPWVDQIHITKIRLAPPSDSFFPNLDASADWTCSQSGPWLEEDGISYVVFECSEGPSG